MTSRKKKITLDRENIGEENNYSLDFFNNNSRFFCLI